MAEGQKTWNEGKLQKSKRNKILKNHNSISMEEYGRFIALELVRNGELHKPVFNSFGKPIIRTS